MEGYVESLECPIDFEAKEIKHFERIKEDALKPGRSAEEMLRIIDYKPKGLPGIYDIAADLDKDGWLKKWGESMMKPVNHSKWGTLIIEPDGGLTMHPLPEAK